MCGFVEKAFPTPSAMLPESCPTINLNAYSSGALPDRKMLGPYPTLAGYPGLTLAASRLALPINMLALRSVSTLGQNSRGESRHRASLEVVEGAFGGDVDCAGANGRSTARNSCKRSSLDP
jgi:hypothetical protein